MAPHCLPRQARPLSAALPAGKTLQKWVKRRGECAALKKSWWV